MATLPTQDLWTSPDGAGSVAAAHSLAPVVLSFDIEEHDRIEAGVGLPITPELSRAYRDRLAPATEWLLDRLGDHGIAATFFIVGDIATHNARLIRAIHNAGHEVASHGWDHQRVHNHTPTSFREDLRRCKGALEQITGEAVVGYRAPTFSIVPRTAWAIEVLADCGMLYDSSIYPIRHDRYGVPGAPRSPFLAQSGDRTILELPPATLRVANLMIPVGGGGYFRLLPLSWMERAIAQLGRLSQPAATMLYFHPWEFDPDQPRLPLSRLNRFRTYVGISRTRDRLKSLLSRHGFARAVDVARELSTRANELVTYRVAL